jgi:predicted Zn-ribbon and HTH transcriptional regulator
MEMLNEQAVAMNERQAEIEQADAIDEENEIELIEQIEADLAYDDAVEAVERENAGFAATIGAKPTRKAVITLNHIAVEGEDTLGVLHSSGVIDKITDKLAVHLEIKMVEGKPVKMTTIECEDCGKERQIKVQDVFQVTRCPECQKKHRNKKRAERRRQQRAEAKAAKAE